MIVTAFVLSSFRAVSIGRSFLAYVYNPLSGCVHTISIVFFEFCLKSIVLLEFCSSWCSFFCSHLSSFLCLFFSLFICCYRCPWSHGLRSKRLYPSVAVTPTPIRLPILRPLVPVSHQLLAIPRTFHLALVYEYLLCPESKYTEFL